MKLFRSALFVFVLLMSGCGGGGDSESSGSGSINLSSPTNMKTLFDKFSTENEKSDFETTAEYDARLETYAQQVTGYYAVETLRATYDADTQELTIPRPLNAMFEGNHNIDNTVFDTEYVRMSIENIDNLFDPTVTGTTEIGGTSYDTTVYDVLIVSAADAQQILDGFRVRYTFQFTSEQIKESRISCLYNFGLTGCTNRLHVTATELDVYNEINGMHY